MELFFKKSLERLRLNEHSYSRVTPLTAATCCESCASRSRGRFGMSFVSSRVLCPRSPGAGAAASDRATTAAGALLEVYMDGPRRPRAAGWRMRMAYASKF